MNLSFLGAGAWGTALAVQASDRHRVCLWTRTPAHAAALRAARENTLYLPGFALPPALAIEANLAAALAHAAGGLLVIATPMAGLRDLLAVLPAGLPATWLCKGFEAGTASLGHEIAAALRPEAPCAVLSGPSFAPEVARGQPTALVAASTDPSLREALAHAFHDGPLRIYTSDDPIGVEVGGAVKNVMAIATGLCDGLAARATPAGGAPGFNARAALITRGLAETTRLAVALGARAETLMGLAGLGDLVLTATGDLSRNRQVGLALAAGRTLQQAVDALGHVAEGVASAPMVLARAQAVGVEMPITEAMVGLLEGRIAAADVVSRLMGREARREH